MDQQRRGLSWIATCIAIIVVIGAVAYVASDPFRSKVDRQLEQATSWTPENIQSDPEGYLFFARGEVDEAKRKLEAGLISTAQRLNRTSQLLIDRTAEADATGALLQDLRAAYLEARSSNLWPAQVRDRMFSQQDLKAKIIEADELYESADTMKSRLLAATKKIQAREKDIRRELSELASTARKLDSDFEMIKTTRVLDELAEITIDLAAISAASTVLSAKPVDDSIAEMINEAKSSVSDDDFERILKGGS
jgi:hypothetical protein